jgi:chemotaxis protein methyltransferase CheR
MTWILSFDRPTQEKLVKRYYDLLEPNGYFILGHSENWGKKKLFENLGKTIFREVG